MYVFFSACLHNRVIALNVRAPTRDIHTHTHTYIIYITEYRYYYHYYYTVIFCDYSYVLRRRTTKRYGGEDNVTKRRVHGLLVACARPTERINLGVSIGVFVTDWLSCDLRTAGVCVRATGSPPTNVNTKRIAIACEYDLHASTLSVSSSGFIFTGCGDGKDWFTLQLSDTFRHDRRRSRYDTETGSVRIFVPGVIRFPCILILM